MAFRAVTKVTSFHREGSLLHVQARLVLKVTHGLRVGSQESRLCSDGGATLPTSDRSLVHFAVRHRGPRKIPGPIPQVRKTWKVSH